MSPLFKQSLSQKFVPKTIKFSKLYQRNVDSKKTPGTSTLNNTKNALRQAGYTDSQILQIITKDTPVPVKQMREVAAILNKAQVYGFEKDPDFAVKQFLNKERIKAQNIAEIRREHILEMADEELEKNPATSSISQAGKGPNMPGNKKITTSFNNKAKTSSSLSDKAGSKKIQSFTDKPHTASSLTKPISGGSPVSFRPKF